MPDAAVFTATPDTDLRAAFLAAAEADHRPAAQVAQELTREFVQRQQHQRDHGTFLHRKVDRARTSVQAGLGRSNEAVAADFAARRAWIADRA